MALSAARRTEHEDIGTFRDPAVASGNGHDLGLGDHRDCIKIKAVERLFRWQVSPGQNTPTLCAESRWPDEARGSPAQEPS